MKLVWGDDQEQYDEVRAEAIECVKDGGGNFILIAFNGV